MRFQLIDFEFRVLVLRFKSELINYEEIHRIGFIAGFISSEVLRGSPEIKTLLNGDRKSMLALGNPGNSLDRIVISKFDAIVNLANQYFNLSLVYKDITKSQIINGLKTINNSTSNAIFSYLGHENYSIIDRPYLHLMN